MNPFLDDGNDSGNLSDGRANIFVDTIQVNSLLPNLPMKTDNNRKLYSTKLSINDVNGLQNMLTNPYAGTIVATDFETANYFSLNEELEKIENFTVATPLHTNLNGTLHADYVSSDTLSDSTNASFILMDSTTINLTAASVLVNGIPIETDTTTLQQAYNLGNTITGDLTLRPFTILNGITPVLNVSATAITGSSFVKTGGGTQFLLANGNVDSTAYLPLTGFPVKMTGNIVFNSNSGTVDGPAGGTLSIGTSVNSVDCDAYFGISAKAFIKKLGTANEVLLANGTTKQIATFNINSVEGYELTPRGARDNWKDTTTNSSGSGLKYFDGLNLLFSFNGETSLSVSQNGGVSWITAIMGTELFGTPAYDPSGKFLVIVGSLATALAYTSTNGLVWTTLPSGNLTTFSAFGSQETEFFNGLFLTTVNLANFNVITSADGITWTARAATNTVYCFHVGLDDANVPILVSAGGNIQYSYDGIIWTTITGTAISGRAITYNSTYKEWIAVDSNGVFYRSLDGKTWTFLSTTTYSNLNNSLIWVGNSKTGAPINHYYFTVTDPITTNYTLVFSPTCSTFKSVKMNGATTGGGLHYATLYMLTYDRFALTVNYEPFFRYADNSTQLGSNGSMLASGYKIPNGLYSDFLLANGATKQISTQIGYELTPRGPRDNWKEDTVNCSGTSLTYYETKNLLFSNGNTAKIGYSQNGGSTWTDGLIGSQLFGTPAYDSVADKFLVMGGSFATALAYTSTNGISWTPLSGGNLTSFDMANSQNTTYFNGFYITNVNLANFNVITSVDGITWTARASAHTVYCFHIGLDDANVPILVSVGGNIQYSYDGLTWTTITGAISGRAITYNSTNKEWIASDYSTGDFYRSLDGKTWTFLATTPYSGLNRLFWVGDGKNDVPINQYYFPFTDPITTNYTLVFSPNCSTFKAVKMNGATPGGGLYYSALYMKFYDRFALTVNFGTRFRYADNGTQLGSNGQTIASGFKIPNGLSTDFLKGDGSVSSMSVANQNFGLICAASTFIPANARSYFYQSYGDTTAVLSQVACYAATAGGACLVRLAVYRGLLTNLNSGLTVLIGQTASFTIPTANLRYLNQIVATTGQTLSIAKNEPFCIAITMSLALGTLLATTGNTNFAYTYYTSTTYPNGFPTQLPTPTNSISQSHVLTLSFQ